MPARTSTPLTKQAVQEAADALADAFVAADGASTLAFAEHLATERARAYRMHGTFPLRSINNRLMLETQVRRRKEDVKGLFAGKAQWVEMDRTVDEDAKPYNIWRARMRKELDANGQETGREFPAGFFLVEVYDWTQTSSLDPDYIEPDWETPLAAGDNATLRQLASSSPVPVIFEDLAAKNYRGRYTGDTIVIDGTAPTGNQIVELARNIARHQLGHPASLPAHAAPDAKALKLRDYTVEWVAEQEAALVGWLVAKSLGLDETVGNDITTQCAEYLHRWCKFNAAGEVITLEGTKSRRKLIKARLDVAIKATDAVLEQYAAAAAAPVAAIA